MDVQATTPVEVPRKFPLGALWLTRRRSNKSTSSLSSDSSGEIVDFATVDAPVPPPKDPRPSAVKMLSDTAVNAATAAFKHRAPQRANTMAGGLMTAASVGVSAAPAVHAPTPGAVIPGAVPGDPNGEQHFPFASRHTDLTRHTAVTTISNVPTWLLNACQALNFLTAEHPKAMTTLSAVLITAGTLPAIPAISGGTVLATGVAQAVGAIAVGVGNLLKAQHEGQIQMNGSAAGPMQGQLQGQAQAPRPLIRAATFQ